MSETPSAPTAAPPGFAALFERSLHAVLSSPAAFRADAERPAPRFRVSAGLALANGAAAIGINLAHAALSNDRFFQMVPPARLASIAVFSLAFYFVLWLSLAGAILALGRALGGAGDFRRAAQGAAVASIAGPLQALCNWFPLVWAVPALLAGWLAAGALEGLFKTAALPARAVCLSIALALVGLQFAVRGVADRLRENRMVDPEVLETLQPAPIPEPEPAPGAAPPPPPESRPAPASGLDMLRLPRGSAPPRAEAPTVEAAREAMRRSDDLRRQAIGMLDSLQPMLADPKIATAMGASAADHRRLQAEIAALRRDLASSRRMTDAEMKQRVDSVQRLVMRMMSGAGEKR